ncbi:MAG TPA: hypothetical protein VEZ90_06695 [Blastocatellia bacterium]|nr:hypothetical protein [Blastocatellia bacterium]
MSGHLELNSKQLEEVARNRNWTEQQIYNARRIIDGGMGSNYGFKEYGETSFGQADEGGLDGFGWVYHLYDDRIEELEALI